MCGPRLALACAHICSRGKTVQASFIKPHILPPPVIDSYTLRISFRRFPPAFSASCSTENSGTLESRTQWYFLPGRSARRKQVNCVLFSNRCPLQYPAPACREHREASLILSLVLILVSSLCSIHLRGRENVGVLVFPLFLPGPFAARSVLYVPINLCSYLMHDTRPFHCLRPPKSLKKTPFSTTTIWENTFAIRPDQLQTRPWPDPSLHCCCSVLFSANSCSAKKALSCLIRSSEMRSCFQVSKDTATVGAP